MILPFFHQKISKIRIAVISIPPPPTFYLPLAKQVFLQADIGSVLANLLEEKLVFTRRPLVAAGNSASS